MIDTTSHILPPTADLRPNVDEIEDQGQLGSCTANACHTEADIRSERRHEQDPTQPNLEFSRLFLYYFARFMEGRFKQDGAYPEDVWRVRRDIGVCLESEWPYDVSKADVQPPESCVSSADQYRISDYWILTPTWPSMWPSEKDNFVNRVKHAICQGRPVEICFQVTQDFVDAGKTCRDWTTFSYNRIPSDTNSPVGGHATVAIGYSDLHGKFLMQNSWTKDWADGGFFSLPYDAFGDFRNGVQSAICIGDNALGMCGDTIGLVPVPGYDVKVYDEMRKQLILQYVSGQILPIRAAAIQYNVPPDEIDHAAGWPQGFAKQLLGL